MHRSCLVPRQSCRAHNAYNVTTALVSAFSTTAAQKVAPGSFASYESLLGDLSRPKNIKQSPATESKKQQRTSNAVHPVPSQSNDLQARQNAIESQLQQSLPPKNKRSPSNKAEDVQVSRDPLSEQRKTKKRVPGDVRIVGQQHPRDGHEKGLITRPLAAVNQDHIARERYVHRLRREQAQVDHVAAQTAGGWKYVMHWIGKTAVAITKDKRFDWNNGPLVGQIRKLLDYEAISLSIAASQMESATSLPWGVSADESSRMQPIQVLDEEIKRFAAWGQPSRAERASRQAVVDQTLHFIDRKLNKSGVKLKTEIFGSQKTGLAAATSDIDIRIYDDSKTGGEGLYSDIGDSMKTLHEYMYNSGEYICTVYRWARFPIISAQHRATGIDIQIVSSPSTTNQQAVTEQYLAELPHLRDLYFVTRTMLGMRNLIDVYNGGIGSYGLFIMLAGALKRRQSNPPTSAGEQLLHFLEMYGQQLDFTRHGLTVNTFQPTKIFLKHQANRLQLYQKERIEAAHRRGDEVRAGQWAICAVRPLQKYLLCLQDPADPKNDLGRKSNGIKFIQGTCDVLAKELRSGLSKIEKGDGHDSSLLEPIVGRCHEILAAQRERVSEFEREVENTKAVQASNEHVEEPEAVLVSKPTAEEEATIVGNHA